MHQRMGILLLPQQYTTGITRYCRDTNTSARVTATGMHAATPAYWYLSY